MGGLNSRHFITNSKFSINNKIIIQHFGLELKSAFPCEPKRNKYKIVQQSFRRGRDGGKIGSQDNTMWMMATRIIVRAIDVC